MQHALLCFGFPACSPVVQTGADSACGLLHMLGSAVDAMDVAALASHHEAVFAALLRALDMRRRRPAALLATRCASLLCQHFALCTHAVPAKASRWCAI
jgi:hypothetical protein